MWQIRTSSGSVEEVFGESSNLIALYFNEGKMLADFAMVIGVASVPKTWQNKQLPNVFLSHIITKEILGRNVALTSFVGRIAIIVTIK
jgi:hypothetical protein